MIYLDNNATTPVARQVADAMIRCLRENYGNPSSVHAIGIRAKKAVEKARKQTAELVGAAVNEIAFTSGGTEANNIAIIGTALRFRKGHIITSCIEHPSVLRPLLYLESLGYKVTYLPVDRHGIVDPAVLKKNLLNSTVLISIMHANNETGAIQPIADIGRIAKERSIPFHSDAAQSVGKIPLNVRSNHLDLATIVAHKFYGPKGVGALYIKAGTTLKPVLFGASHEKGVRPGTENVSGIVGLGKAADLAKKELSERVSEMKSLSNMLYRDLRRHIPGLKLNSHYAKRLPNTINVSFPGVRGSLLLDKLKNDIAASTGSACHEGMHSPSPVLRAIGLSDADALSAIRLSLGRTTTKNQIRHVVTAIINAYRNLRTEV